MLISAHLKNHFIWALWVGLSIDRPYLQMGGRVSAVGICQLWLHGGSVAVLAWGKLLQHCLYGAPSSEISISEAWRDHQWATLWLTITQ